MSSETDVDTELEKLNLTPELERMTKAFGTLSDEKTRYKQLLFMASKLAPMSLDQQKPENKVPGCLSTVYVDCTVEQNEETGEHDVIKYVGESDGQLTKGLVALLIRGLSGCTADQIQKVDPEFINVAKISQSLTPGRNNGFLNMLAVMKQKAAEAVSSPPPSSSANGAGEETAEEGIVTSFEEMEGKPMYNEMMGRMIGMLKPVEIEIVDNSDKHAGHAGSKGFDGESHFALRVVADAFDGLALVKRHQLIYLLLGDVMDKIHALEIKAQTPSEAASK
jgi:sulfur transfer protein SufE/stress-induced morphogen